MGELLFRLMLELPDGTFKVVGHEKWENGKIYHATYNHPNVWLNIMDVCCDMGVCDFDEYIDHTRKDQYTGVEVDGVKVFERDEVRQIKPKFFELEGVVTWNVITLAWSVIGEKGQLSLSDFISYPSLFSFKITGISGVTNA